MKLNKQTSRADGFQPDWASAPGETISEILQEENISILEFAKRLNKTQKYTQKLLCGDQKINAKTANQLEQILKAPAEFWIAREAQYREDLARLTSKSKKKSKH
jgi:HTH-type transcriptional regulator/antitoxin HigA